jgi:hypothetical protein
MSRPDLANEAAEKLWASKGPGNVMDAPVAIDDEDGSASWHRIAHGIDHDVFTEYDKAYFGSDGGYDELGGYW